MQCEYTTPAVTEPRKIAPRLTPFSSRAGKRRNARLRMSGRYRCHHTAPWRARLPDMFSGFIISARRPAGSAPQQRTSFGLRHGFAHRKMSCVCTPRLLLHQLFLNIETSFILHVKQCSSHALLGSHIANYPAGAVQCEICQGLPRAHTQGNLQVQHGPTAA